MRVEAIAFLPSLICLDLLVRHTEGLHSVPLRLILNFTRRSRTTEPSFLSITESRRRATATSD